MPFPPIDLLAPVVALLTTDLGGFDRLTVDVGDPGCRFAPRSHPDLGAQGIDHPLPSAVIAPLGEVVIDGALGQEVVRQHVPLAAGAGLIAEGVENLAHVDFARPPAGLGRWDEGLENLPLSVGQIGRIGFTHRAIGGYAEGWTSVPMGIVGPNRLSG